MGTTIANLTVPSHQDLIGDIFLMRFFYLSLFKTTYLNEMMCRSGYQKFVEEEINRLAGRPLALWDLQLEPLRRYRVSTLTFNGIMIVILIASILTAVSTFWTDGVLSLVKSGGIDLFAYGLFSALLIWSYYEVFTAKDKFYRYARKSTPVSIPPDSLC